MKTKSIIYLLVAFLISGSVSWAQNPSKTGRTTNKNMSEKNTRTKVDMHAASGGTYGKQGLPGEKGGAYLIPDFIEGTIVLKDGSVLEDKPLRYNLYTQQMQYIVDQDTLALGNPDEIERIQMEDKVFVYADYLCKGKHKSGYFELLESGDCRLLKRWMALYQEVDKTVDQGNDCDVFYRDCQCFLQFFMNPAQVVHLKKKDFLKSFANNSDKVENYMREDKLKPKNEADLIRIVEYYNTLAASD